MTRAYSRLDMIYAVRLANRGYNLPMIFRALAAKPSGRREPGSVKYQRVLDERGREVADAYATRTATRALEWVRKNPPVKDRGAALEKVLEVRDAADGLPWFVYGGPGPRRALEAAFVVAERVGGPRFGLALREWAEISGQGFEAIRIHRDTLGHLGWLNRDPSDRAGRTSRFTLRVPSHVFPHSLTPGDENVGTPTAPQTAARWLAHDAFREEGLGDSGWLLLHEISRTVLSFEWLSFRTGLSLPRLTEWLGWLEDWGLVEIGPEGVATTSGALAARLDAVASKRRTAGQGVRDRSRHRQEREAFRSRVDVNVGRTRSPG